MKKRSALKLFCLFNLMVWSYSTAVASPTMYIVNAVAIAKDEKVTSNFFGLVSRSNVTEFFKKHHNNINGNILTWSGSAGASTTEIICSGNWNGSRCNGDALILELIFAKAEPGLRGSKSRLETGSFEFIPPATNANQARGRLYFQTINRTFVAAVGLNRDNSDIKEFFRKGISISRSGDIESEVTPVYRLLSNSVYTKNPFEGQKNSDDQDDNDDAVGRFCAFLVLDVDVRNGVNDSTIKLTKKPNTVACNPSENLGYGGW